MISSIILHSWLRSLVTIAFSLGLKTTGYTKYKNTARYWCFVQKKTALRFPDLGQDSCVTVLIFSSRNQCFLFRIKILLIFGSFIESGPAFFFAIWTGSHRARVAVAWIKVRLNYVNYSNVYLNFLSLW